MNLLNPACQIAPRERYAAAFFSECFIDELARAAWRDPVQYRREMLPGSSRLRRVLDEAARISGWSRPAPAGRARGIALSAASGAVAAHVAEMSMDERGDARVHRIVAVIDCGPADRAEAACRLLHDSLQARWHTHAPQLDVRVLASDAPSSNPGDAEYGLAPAMANALVALRGRQPGRERGAS